MCYKAPDVHLTQCWIIRGFNPIKTRSALMNTRCHTHKVIGHAAVNVIFWLDFLQRNVSDGARNRTPNNKRLLTEAIRVNIQPECTTVIFFSHFLLFNCSTQKSHSCCVKCAVHSKKHKIWKTSSMHNLTDSYLVAAVLHVYLMFLASHISHTELASDSGNKNHEDPHDNKCTCCSQWL